MALMVGDTSRLQDAGDFGTGNHSWARSDIQASCQPLYRIDDQILPFSTIDDFRQSIPCVDDHCIDDVVEYSFPDALILQTVEILYPFAFLLDDWHVQITMPLNKFVRVRIPCGTQIIGLPLADANSEFIWIEEHRILTTEGICHSIADSILLVMAYMDNIFVRVYI